MKLSDVLVICFTNIILIATSAYVPGFLSFFLLSLRKRKPVTAATSTTSKPSTTSTTTVPPKSCSAGYTFYPGPGKSFCYRIYSDCKTWDDARSACQMEGADLTSLDDASLEPFSEVLKQQFRENRNCFYDDSVWLGATTNDTFVAIYINGKSIPSDSLMWGPFNPEMSGTCIFCEFGPVENNLYDLRCAEELQYVCQKL